MTTTTTFYPGYSQINVTPNLRTREIASITQAYPMVVTTVLDHGYPAGMNITFLIPPYFGMVQLNTLNAQVISVTNKSLTVNLDSTHFTPFAAPSPLPSAYTPPSVIPNASGPYLPPQPLPYGNQVSFEGVVYNAGEV